MSKNYGFQDESGVGLVPASGVATRQENLSAIKEEFLALIQKYESYCNNFVIDSPESWQEADRKVQEGERIKRGIKEKTDPIVSDRHKAHKEATKFRSSLIDPIEMGSQSLLSKMRVFRVEQDRKAEAERQRIEEENRKKQEEACLKQAAEMEKEGAPQEAIDSVLDLAEDPLPEVHVAQPVLRSKTSFIRDWDVEVVDKHAVPEKYKTVDLATIKRVVKAEKGQSKIPGIKITETTSTRRSSGRG